MEELVAPVEAEPAHVLLDRLDVLDVLGLRVRVVEAQVADAALVLQGDPEVQAAGLGVADVQIAVRLGREPRDNAASVPVRSQVLGDLGADEIARLLHHSAASVPVRLLPPPPPAPTPQAGSP